MQHVAVLDVNIWVTFFIKNKMEQLVGHILDKQIVILTSPYLITELETVLARPKFASVLNAPVVEYINFHVRLSKVCVTTPLFQESPDPEDNYLFDLAVQYSADYLVTGDKNLLALKRVDDIQIITLDTFINI